MILGDNEVTLTGRKFLANIAQPENFPSGLININPDPRKQKKKPDVFVGIVEEVGSGCIFVKPGQKVSFRRWEWEQFNVDDERIIADETDLIIIGDNEPAPGIIVLDLIDHLPKTGLSLPDTIRPEKTRTYKGEIVAFSSYLIGHELKDLIDVGKILVFERSDSKQWTYGGGRIAIKVCSYFEIIAIGEKCSICQDLCLKHSVAELSVV